MGNVTVKGEASLPCPHLLVAVTVPTRFALILSQADLIFLVDNSHMD